MIADIACHLEKVSRFKSQGSFAAIYEGEMNQ